MEQQEKYVLNGFYKNAAVGKDAIFCVLEHTEDPELRKELCTQLEYYENQQQKIRQQMKASYLYPQEQGTLAKFCSSASIRMRCLGNTNSSRDCKTNGRRNKYGIDSVISVIKPTHRYRCIYSTTGKRNDTAGRGIS